MATTLSTAAAVLGALFMAGAGHADTVFGLYAGAGAWQQQYSGDVAAGGDNVDVERDLDLDDDANNLAYLAIEHGIPILPNLRLNYSEVQTTGFNTLNRTVRFRGEVFTVSEEVRSELDFRQADVLLYYELLDNVVSLDVGAGARWVEGDVQVASDADVGRADFQGVVPLLYGRARLDLPLTGFWVGADLMGLTYDGHDYLDASAQLGWQSPIGLGVEVGWRALELDLDGIDDIEDAEIDIRGPYAAVNFHF